MKRSVTQWVCGSDWLRIRGVNVFLSVFLFGFTSSQARAEASSSSFMQFLSIPSCAAGETSSSSCSALGFSSTLELFSSAVLSIHISCDSRIHKLDAVMPLSLSSWQYLFFLHDSSNSIVSIGSTWDLGFITRVFWVKSDIEDDVAQVS